MQKVTVVLIADDCLREKALNVRRDEWEQAARRNKTTAGHCS
jgi:hypothetical protein